MRKYNNPRLLNTVVAGPGMKHPTKPHVIVGDNGEFIQGDLMDANAIGELVDQKIDDSEEHIIPKIDELSAQLEQEITDREAADEDLSETIDSRIQDVVGAAPEALDTLKELADALNDDANFAATVTNELTELDERVDNNTSGISSLDTRVTSLETSTPDWNESDPTSPSYIKNRTHYEETSERTLYTGNIVPVYSENNEIFFDIPLDSLMQSGEEIEMKITPRGADGPTVLRGIADNDGKAHLETSYYPDGPSAALYNEYIYGVCKFNLVIYGITVPQDTDFEIEIKVFATVHVLNEKFIPATIARTEELRSGVFYDSNTSRLANGDGRGISNIKLSRINFDAGSSNSINYLHNLNMLTGDISGVHNLNMNSGVINMGSGGTLDMGLGSITNVKDIKFNGDVTLTTGNGAVASGEDAIWAKNFGVSGDLLFSGDSTVQKRFGSGALPVVTFEETYFPSTHMYKDIMSLGKDKALSVIAYYNEKSPRQSSDTPIVNISGKAYISGTLNVSGTIYGGSTSNTIYTISGSSEGMDIRTTSGRSVNINGVKINSSGSISEGTIQNTTFESGNIFTSGFINELKAALGLQ